MATYTPNYNLKKPATSDNVSIADINGNMDMIDTELKSLDTEILCKSPGLTAGNGISITSDIVVPSGYLQLESIEATGTQYINTGVAVNDNNSFYLDLTVKSTSGYIISQGNVSLRTNSLQWYTKNYHFGAYGSGRKVIECGYNFMKVDGVDISGQSDSDSVGGTYVYLMARNDGSQIASGIVHRFKVFNSSSALAFDGVPAKRISDGAIGLYDLVSSAFFGNDGTGEFVAGQTKAYSGTISTSEDFDGFVDRTTDQRLAGKKVFTEYPMIDADNPYQAVEYISLDSSQPWTTSFQLNLSFSNVATIKVKMALTSVATHAPIFIMAYNSGSYSATDPWLSANGQASGNLSLSNPIAKDTLDTPTEFVVVNNGSTGLIRLGTYVDQYWSCGMDYYYAKFYDANNDLVAYLTPCYRKSDNAIGMYDQINDVFYNNAGSGTFTKGPNTDSGAVVDNPSKHITTVADVQGMMPKIISNTSVSSWSADNTYQDYPYRASIAITGVTANDTAEVVFALAQATSGDYAPVCETYSGGVYVYSAVNDSITIPTIIIFKG